MQRIFSFFLFLFLIPGVRSYSQEKLSNEMEVFHTISSHDILEYASELTSEKYRGRLSGSPGYAASAGYVAGLLREWGLKPAVNDTSYFQWFPNAYTEVLNPGKVMIHRGKEAGSARNRKLGFPEEYYPGSNSATGIVTGEVVYAGFGISAPELGYDDYAGLDVKGKIVLLESGTPYSRDDSVMLKWEPYSYHRYKFQHAMEMGAAGLLYVGLTANPNTTWTDGFVYAHISEAIADDILSEKGISYSGLKAGIAKKMEPGSFPLRRKVTIKASTRHFPHTNSCNVAGIIEGSDPVLKHEAIIVGAHLDAIGHPGMLFPGALDNASGCADLLGAARALASLEVKPRRSVIFLFFGGEECGLYGSTFYTQNPLWPKEKVQLMLNLDMVGNGTGFFLQGGLSSPELLHHFTSGNDSLIHRPMRATENRSSFGRSRTDGAVFQKAGYPMMNLWTSGTVKPVFYHQPLDNTDGLTPEIMEDAAKLLYLGIQGIANDPSLKP